MPDVLLLLIILLIGVVIWRGPKTLPQLGRAFGQGVKEARKEIDEMKGEMSAEQAAKDDETGTKPSA
jgi:TatA/E family protein of Tat protein translocase